MQMVLVSYIGLIILTSSTTNARFRLHANKSSVAKPQGSLPRWVKQRSLWTKRSLLVMKNCLQNVAEGLQHIYVAPVSDYSRSVKSLSQPRPPERPGPRTTTTSAPRHGGFLLLISVCALITANWTIICHALAFTLTGSVASVKYLKRWNTRSKSVQNIWRREIVWNLHSINSVFLFISRKSSLEQLLQSL